MEAKEFYEAVHGTGDESYNLNKDAIINLMQRYHLYRTGYELTNPVEAASGTPVNSVFHKEASAPLAVSTAGEILTNQQVWLKAWCATANANACLKDFKKKFRNE